MEKATWFLGMFLAAQIVSADTFSFVAIGDMPYGKPSKVYPKYEALIDEINRHQPAFVFHVGDTKRGNRKCSDKVLQKQLDFMNTIESAMIYTPGDNEWTDCHRPAAGRYDPVERLQKIRQLYFSSSLSLGQQPIPLTRQSDTMNQFQHFVENQRFQHGDITIFTAHIVGSNNNFRVDNAVALAEFSQRDDANVAWIISSFHHAMRLQSKAVILAIHADMFDFGFADSGEVIKISRDSGFENVGKAIVEKAKEFAKPVLLVFGDSHKHRIFRPFPDEAPNIKAVEVYGKKQMHGVKIEVDTDAVDPFTIFTVVNPALGDPG